MEIKFILIMNLSVNMCADNINHHNTSVFIDVLRLFAEKGVFEPSLPSV